MHFAGALKGRAIALICYQSAISTREAIRRRRDRRSDSARGASCGAARRAADRPTGVLAIQRLVDRDRQGVRRLQRRRAAGTEYLRLVPYVVKRGLCVELEMKCYRRPGRIVRASWGWQVGGVFAE